MCPEQRYLITLFCLSRLPRPASPDDCCVSVRLTTRAWRVRRVILRGAARYDGPARGLGSIPVQVIIRGNSSRQGALNSVCLVFRTWGKSSSCSRYGVRPGASKPCRKRSAYRKIRFYPVSGGLAEAAAFRKPSSDRIGKRPTIRPYGRRAEVFMNHLVSERLLVGARVSVVDLVRIQHDHLPWRTRMD